MNLPPEDNLRKEDKSSAPKVSFIRRFHWQTLKHEKIHDHNKLFNKIIESVNFEYI